MTTPMTEDKPSDAMTEQERAIRAAGRCPYNHPEGTRCPACQDALSRTVPATPDDLVAKIMDDVIECKPTRGLVFSYDQVEYAIQAALLSNERTIERLEGERDAARELLVIAAKRQSADDQRIRELEGQLRALAKEVP